MIIKSAKTITDAEALGLSDTRLKIITLNIRLSSKTRAEAKSVIDAKKTRKVELRIAGVKRGIIILISICLLDNLKTLQAEIRLASIFLADISIIRAVIGHK